MFSTARLASGCRRAAQCNLFSGARLKSTLRKGSAVVHSKEVSEVRYFFMFGGCLTVSHHDISKMLRNP